MNEEKKVDSTCGSGKCRCGHHSIAPALVALLGLVFLAGNLSWISASAVSIIWPIVIIVLGLMKIGSRNCKCC